MKVLFEKSFLKDIKKLNDNKLKARIDKAIDEVKESENLSAISKAEKLKGHATAYKIKLGDYRVGIFVEKDTVIFSRFLHRKEVYKRFQ